MILETSFNLHLVAAAFGIAGIGVFISILAIIVYRIWFHPLAKYHGPLLGKFSELAIYASIFRQDHVMYLHDQLQKYGSPVRVSTN